MRLRWFAAFVLAIDVIALAILVGIYLQDNSGVPDKETNGTSVPALTLYTKPSGPASMIDGKVIGDVRVRNGSVRVFHFNGSGYIDLSDTLGEVGELKQGSISLAFRYEETDQKVLPILYIGDREGENLFIIEIGHKGGNNRRLYVTWIPGGDKPALCFDSRFNLKPGKWYHLIVVVSNEGNTAYLNGRKMTWRHYNFGNESMRLFFADIPDKELFTIGYGKTGEGITPGFLYFHGDVADLRIYSWPLNPEEAKEIVEDIKVLTKH